MKLPPLTGTRRSSGFSLIEVVVALSILSVGIVILIQLFSSSLRTIKKSEDYSKALAHARSLMEEAYSKLEIRDVEGSFNLGEGFTATRQVSLVSSEDKAVVYKITVTVYWPPTGKMELNGKRTVYENKE